LKKNKYHRHRKERVQRVAIIEGSEVKIVLDGKELKSLITKIKITPLPQKGPNKYPRIGDVWLNEKDNINRKYVLGNCTSCGGRTKDWLMFCCDGNDGDCSCKGLPTESFICPKCKADEWLKEVTESDTNSVLSYLQG
jgi:hypothetical protein